MDSPYYDWLLSVNQEAKDLRQEDMKATKYAKDTVSDLSRFAKQQKEYQNKLGVRRRRV